MQDMVSRKKALFVSYLTLFIYAITMFYLTNRLNNTEEKLFYKRLDYNSLTDKYDKLYDDYMTLSKDYANIYQNYTVTERFRMYHQSLANESNYINGIAYGDQYYCVWTKDRSYEYINKTANHEMLHILIEKNRTHFCGG
jgi:hypothetical protein